MREPTRLALAGASLIAVTFGPARNGFGLFLPQLRTEFGLSVELSGVIASAAQGGYLVALTVVGLLAARVGPRPLIVACGCCAAAGLALAAAAPRVGLLATGVVLAASSAGWTWAPYNDATKAAVGQSRRGRVLSVISTGTTVGVLGAGVVALAVGAGWRVAFLVFTIAAVVATVGNVGVLGAPVPAHTAPLRGVGVRWFLRPGSGALFVAAWSFGVTSAFVWAFAVDHVERTGVLPVAAGPAFFIVVGAAGFAGFFAAELVGRFGLRPVLVGVLVSSAISSCLLALAPGSLAAVAVAAALYGAVVMLSAAVLSMWSSAVFEEQPSTGFSGTLFVFGTGAVTGPVALGALAGRSSLGTAFLVVAAISGVTALVRPRTQLLLDPGGGTG